MVAEGTEASFESASLETPQIQVTNDEEPQNIEQEQIKEAPSLLFDVTRHLGTKTPYRPPNPNALAELDIPPMCTLINVQTIARHGSRYPTVSTIKVRRLP